MLFSLHLSACSEIPSYSPLAEGSVVLAFGDSVTYGTGAQRSAAYPLLLAQRSGWNVINEGIPGDTAYAARSRIAATLQKHRPKLVIIELGGNDFLRQRADHDVKEDLRAIIRAVKEYGAQPVLVAVPSVNLFNWGLSDAPLYAALAEEENLLLVKDVFAAVLSDPFLRSDLIHPNQEGYQTLAAGIGDALYQAGLLARRDH